MRKYPLLLPLFAAMMLITSCVTKSYFQSPLSANTNSYRAIPLKSDSMKAATYLSATFTNGGANEQRDGLIGFIGSLHRGHQLGAFQGYYGVTGMAGNYRIDKASIKSSDPAMKALADNKFFGAYGVVGGINVVLPFSSGSEWRIIGTELSWQKEFGAYKNFRKQLPDSLADIIERHSGYFTFGFATDLVVRLWRNGSIGYKIGFVSSSRTLRNKSNTDSVKPGYFSQTLHLSKQKYTGFLQLNFGTYAMSMQLGLNYRLNW